MSHTEKWEVVKIGEPGVAEQIRDLTFQDVRKALACNLAMFGLFGLYDKQGKPLAEHVMRVSCTPNLSDDQEIAALLHDCLEDCPDLVTEQIICHFFGPKVLGLVLILTRRSGESYPEYIDRVVVSREAIPIKLADLRDNLDLSRGPIPPTQRLKYQRAKESLEIALGAQTTEPVE